MYHIVLVIKCRRVDSIDDYPIEDVDEKEVDIIVDLNTYNYLQTLPKNEIMNHWNFEYRWSSYKDCNNYIILEAIDIIDISFLGISDTIFKYDEDTEIVIPKVV